MKKYTTHLLLLLVTMDIAILGLGQQVSQGSVVSISDLYNIISGCANHLGTQFPIGEMYDQHGKVKPLYKQGRDTLVIFVQCHCTLPQTNKWAKDAKRNGEYVVQVFPGSPKALQHIVKSNVIVGDAVTCSVRELYSLIGEADVKHLPIGYHLDSQGKLISKLISKQTRNPVK